MTTERRYTCNLCRCALQDANAPEASFARKGVGVEFRGDRVIFRLLSGAENHLCNECVEAVWAERDGQKGKADYEKA